MSNSEEISPESAQKLIRMAEELMVTRQALEHALSTNGDEDLSGAKAALKSVVLLSDQVNETIRQWLEREETLRESPH